MIHHRIAASSIGDDELAKRFGPVFEKIAAGAVERERNRTLPFDEIRLLKDAGIGALRVPVEFGGLGATLRQTFDLLIGLAASDSNLSQALRVHFSITEDLRLHKDELVKARWLKAIADGALVGVAVTELGVGAVDRYRTAIKSSASGLRLNGTKYYTTGTLYADHLVVAADQDGGEFLSWSTPISLALRSTTIGMVSAKGSQRTARRSSRTSVSARIGISVPPTGPKAAATERLMCNWFCSRH